MRRILHIKILILLLLGVLGANAQVLSPIWHTTGQKINSGTGTSLSVDAPENLNEDDLIILVFASQKS